MTPIGYDNQGNVLSYRMELVRIVEVIKDRGDHSDMKTKEIEEYKELLCQLEPSSENEYDDLPKVMS